MEKAVITVKAVFDAIDGFAPFESCEKWDNSGLLTGKFESEVSGIIIALDMSMKVLDEAINRGINTVVTHHPILFGGRKNLREDDAEGRLLCAMVRNNINLISAHTNFDKASGGVNDLLAESLGLKNVTGIEGDEEGYLRIGDIQKMSLSAFACLAKQTLGDEVRAYGQGDKMIERVAVCGGAGGEFARLCMEKGADAYLTGEMRYHDSLDLAQAGFATLHAGHDATEKLALKGFEDLFKAEFPDTKIVLCKNDGFSVSAKS